MNIKDNLAQIHNTLPENVTLVCVSKFHPTEAIQEAYDAGERDFGESRVQEILTKVNVLPKDIRWHFIGHLQTNKVKQILPFVCLIQSVDSLHLLEKINDEAEKINRKIDVLLEVHVAKEETKTGFSIDEVQELINTNAFAQYHFVNICGFMGMATNTEDEAEIRKEFALIKHLSLSNPQFPILSMGMSGDYQLAVAEGTNMVRVGSSIFGQRIYS